MPINIRPQAPMCACENTVNNLKESEVNNMVIVHRQDTNRTMSLPDEFWLKTLIKVTPENQLKRISSGTFSIVIQGVKFIVSNDWAIDNQHFTFNTDYMLKHNLL